MSPGADPAHVAALRTQSMFCARTGSVLSAALLARLADDAEAGGPTAALLAGWTGHPVLDALALRLLGALHARVLSGEAPGLARFYPTAGGRFEEAGAWPAVRRELERDPEQLRAALCRGVQTNEVRRCAALLGGFLEAADASGLPLRVLEIGASAGLNLLFDRWRYDLGAYAWGDRAAPLHIATRWEGPPPALGAPLHVAERGGCDVAPIDVDDPAARLRLRSFVWGDQPERLQRLDAALRAAQLSPARVARETASHFLERALAVLPEGAATVVFQSHVWWYLGDAERAHVTSVMEGAGAQATRRAPLFWLRFEGAHPERSEIALRRWPGAREELLGRAHHHGAWVAWGSAAADFAGRAP